MKGLLQSKKFRKNLGKWLFMYVGVMLLLTSVVTYSKYISSLQGSGKAATARFELTVKCSDNNGQNCGSSPLYRVDETTGPLILNYKFTVDPSKLDVKSNLKLLIFVDKSFIIDDISTGFMPCENKDASICPQNSNMYYINTLSTTDVLTFTMTVHYNEAYKSELQNTNKNAPLAKEVVAVGYKIDQVK